MAILKRSMILGIVCLGILCAHGTHSAELKKDPKIVIIGAGTAGIGAATRLFEKGFKDITILEAENRIGGRIQTVDFGKYKVDFGAEFIDGVLPQNPVYELVKSYDLVDRNDDRGVQVSFYDSMAGLVEKGTVDKLQHFYQHLYKLDAEKDYPSLGDYMENKFQEEFKSTELYKEAPKYLNFYELMSTYLRPAKCWKDLPVKDKEFKVYGGDHTVNWKNNGYSKFFDVLMKKYPKPEEELPVMKNLKLNTEVMNIDYSKGKDGSVVVTTKDGKTFEADHVIVTVPLGVLKERYQKMFTPALPEMTIKAINAVEFGNQGKILLQFDKPFWKVDDGKMMYLNLLWTEHCKAIYQKSEDKSWLLGVPGFTNIPGKPDLLWMVVVGEYAKAMETLPEGKVFEHAKELLHYFFDKSHTVSDPIKMARSQWYSDQHFRGTFSYNSLETEEMKVSRKMFNELMNQGNMKLLFAGEAMSVNRYATIDGALESGWEMADKLSELYKM